LTKAHGLRQASPHSIARRPLYFTICSNNYLHFARTLGDSLRRIDPDIAFVVFLADEPAEITAKAAGELRIIPGRELGISSYVDMAFKYSIMEFNTALKPFCFDHAFDALNFRSAIYLDPDILVLKPLADVERLLAEGASCVLTPHATAPIADGQKPDDYTFLTCGGFNLGFVALSASAEARAFNSWWGQKLKDDCFVALERGVFVDQKFADLAPSFMENVRIVRHPGYNLAYWNLVHRKVTEVGGELRANDAPVHFVHFSGIDRSDRERFSRHQDRWTRGTVGDALRRLYDDYLARLDQNDACGAGLFYSRAPYAYDRLVGGATIAPMMRRVYRYYRSETKHGGDPFTLASEFFTATSEAVPGFEGVRISRLYHVLWRERPDLRSAFDLRSYAGQVDFVRWAATSLSDYPKMFIEPIPQVRGGGPLIRTLARRSSTLRNAVHRLRKLKRRGADYLRRRPDGGTSGAHSAEHSLDGAAAGFAQSGAGTLSIHGLFKLETGTGQLARGFARAMLAVGSPVSCHDISIAAGFDQKEAFEASSSHFSSSTTALICLNADTTAHLDHYIAPEALLGKRRIGHWVWELPEFPDQWSDAIEKVDEIWTPTHYVASAVRKKTHKPVRVVPYVVDRTEQSSSRARAAFGLPGDRPLVLMAYDYNSFVARKNPAAGVRAFLDAFGEADSSSPMLVIKCHGRVKDDSELKDLIGSHTHIRLIDEVLRDPEMCMLQNACDIFLSVHRAEGFGLNIAECMLLGKLAIATGFSGNQDFMTSANSIVLPFEMVAVGRGQYPFGEGQYWASPKHDAVVDALRSAVSNFERTGRLREQARLDIRNLFSAESVGRRIMAALES